MSPCHSSTATTRQSVCECSAHMITQSRLTSILNCCAERGHTVSRSPIHKCALHAAAGFPALPLTVRKSCRLQRALGNVGWQTNIHMSNTAHPHGMCPSLGTTTHRVIPSYSLCAGALGATTRYASLSTTSPRGHSHDTSLTLFVIHKQTRPTLHQSLSRAKA